MLGFFSNALLQVYIPTSRDDTQMNIDVKDTSLMKFLSSTQTVYYGKALELRDAVRGWLSYIPETFPHYTRHTVEHSEEIIVQISKLIYDDESEQLTIKLTPLEAYVLMTAAYLHDAGMVTADQEKIEIISSNDEWKKWISAGGAARRWGEIKELRKDSSLDEQKRHFLADLQTRYLLAEFIRRQHHYRAGEVIKQHEDSLGRFAFNDPVLMRTLADVCIAHGLRHFELEDIERFPEKRDIQGYRVNVRLMAILLRLGDLLDMSCDRACPLLMNPASPIPADSLAHWTQYQRITHRSTSPKKIEITAECQQQEEHRLLQDWCQWIVEEVQSANVLLNRSETYPRWQPPEASIGESGTIKIRPATGANYIPSAWTFEMDEEAVLQLIIKDVYQNPQIFIRELIQNALDATRCQMYMDLRKDGLREPDYPTEAEQSRRECYPLTITLESRPIVNLLSGEVEDKQFLIVEDCGIGMDREVIERYFLQVGRSYYTSEAFRRNYQFIPTSRFGIGFLSVFAVSDSVTVETYKPSSSKPEAIRLTITGPRNYLLTEQGNRRVNGTRIEIQLREPISLRDALGSTVDWCKRVEFPIELRMSGTQQTISAETAEQFLYERPDLRQENGRFVVRAFPIDYPGLEGEVYVFARIDETGESWVSSEFERDVQYHPNAGEFGTPQSLICLHGIAFTNHVLESLIFPERIFQGYKASFRMDIRDKNYQPSLSRDWNSFLADEHKDVLRQTLMSAVNYHLASTDLAKSSDSWKYKNELAKEYPFKEYWNSCPDMIPIYREGQFSTRSLDEMNSVKTITSTHKMCESSFQLRLHQAEPASNAELRPDKGDLILGSDLSWLGVGVLSSLLDNRIPVQLTYLDEAYFSVVWELAERHIVVGHEIAGSHAYQGTKLYLGIKVSDIRDANCIAYFARARRPFEWARGLWNTNNSVVDWLVRAQVATRNGSCNLNPQLSIVFEFLNAFSSGSSLQLSKLNKYLGGWKDIPDIQEDLLPPQLEITEDMFMFLG